MFLKTTGRALADTVIPGVRLNFKLARDKEEAFNVCFTINTAALFFFRIKIIRIRNYRKLFRSCEETQRNQIISERDPESNLSNLFCMNSTSVMRLPKGALYIKGAKGRDSLREITHS